MKDGYEIGGAPVTRDFADSIGAEGFAEDCASAVDEAKAVNDNQVIKEARYDIEQRTF